MINDRLFPAGIKEPIMQSSSASIVHAFKQLLEKEFGTRLFSVLLFGSIAQNRATEASDIDIAVVLHQPVDWLEKQKIHDLAFEAEGDSGRLINAVVFSKDEFEGRGVESLLLVENIMEQGIAV
jgi:predicted nucleotidyltransferase